MMTLYLGQVSRLVHTIKHFLLVTPHLLDVTLYFSMNGTNIQQLLLSVECGGLACGWRRIPLDIVRLTVIISMWSRSDRTNITLELLSLYGEIALCGKIEEQNEPRA